MNQNGNLIITHKNDITLNTPDTLVYSKSLDKNILFKFLIRVVILYTFTIDCIL